MIIFSIISVIFLILGIILVLKITPKSTASVLMQIIIPKQSLRDKVKIAQGRKKTNKITKELLRIREALIKSGNSDKFAVIFSLSLILFIVGIFISVLIENIFLVPILSFALAMIPFAYAKSIVTHYEKHIQLEMETALSIVTNSYLRTDDIVNAVSENISYLKPPVGDMFKAFLGDATAISADIKSSLETLKSKIDNDIWREWCDSIILCQGDRTLKTSLLAIVNKLTDVRIVNNELKTILYEPRKEFWMMVGLVLGNIPLLYMLSHDWFNALIFTVSGKITLAICTAAILVTTYFMLKFTKPIEYKG